MLPTNSETLEGMEYVSVRRERADARVRRFRQHVLGVLISGPQGEEQS